MMNAEAKMMMLLAAVDGTIDELQTMRRVDNINNVSCLHFVFEESTSTAISRMKAKEYYVPMKPIGFDREKIGTVGRCVCGKVYYCYDISATPMPITGGK